MLAFVTALTNELKTVTTNAHYGLNRDDVVTYPYLTFDIDSERLERNVEGFYVDIDMFDHNTSYARLFELEEQLKDHFLDRDVMNEDVLIRFVYNGSTKVPTGDETIVRRNLRFYAKTDWRKK